MFAWYTRRSEHFPPEPPPLQFNSGDVVDYIFPPTPVNEQQAFQLIKTLQQATTHTYKGTASPNPEAHTHTNIQLLHINNTASEAFFLQNHKQSTL